MTSQAPNQNVTTVATNVRCARIAAGLTQRALAGKLGLDIRAVNRWEKGGISPSPANLAKLADLFNHDIAWFYTDHSEQVAA